MLELQLVQQSYAGFSRAKWVNTSIGPVHLHWTTQTELVIFCYKSGMPTWQQLNCGLWGLLAQLPEVLPWCDSGTQGVNASTTPHIPLLPTAEYRVFVCHWWLRLAAGEKGAEWEWGSPPGLWNYTNKAPLCQPVRSLEGPNKVNSPGVRQICHWRWRCPKGRERNEVCFCMFRKPNIG